MIEAYGENVILKPVVEEEGENKTTSGLILVSDFDEGFPRGVVLNKGVDVPEWVNVGDTVVFHEQFCARIDCGDEEYISINYKTIYGREV